MAFVEAEPGALVAVTLDRNSPSYGDEVTAFLAAVERAKERSGGDTPVHVVREEGSLLHVQVFAASSVPGGTKGADGFGQSAEGPVDLLPPSKQSLPQGSSQLADELRALKHKSTKP